MKGIILIFFDFSLEKKINIHIYSIAYKPWFSFPKKKDCSFKEKQKQRKWATSTASQNPLKNKNFLSKKKKDMIFN